MNVLDVTERREPQLLKTPPPPSYHSIAWVLLQFEKKHLSTESVSPLIKDIAPPLSEEVRDVKVQEVNVADEDISLSGSLSGSSQDVIVPLLLMQFLYVGSTLVRGI